MTQEQKSRIVPGLRSAGIHSDFGMPAWAEIPAAPQLAQLEERANCGFATAGVLPEMLQVALIAWMAQHGRPRPAQWQRVAEGVKVPIPVVRRLDGGNLQLLEGAGSVLALMEAKPPSDGLFPALLAV